MIRKSLAALVLALAMGNALPAPAPTTAPAAESANVTQVWQREAEYWRYVAAGDVENYVTLWDARFIGWPCDQPHPLGKSGIGDWVRKIRDEHIKVDANLVHEGAQDFGDVVVVHYRFTRVDTYPDGRVEGQGRERKITHTWMKVGPDWLIIGGMCGDLGSASN
ncbi:MAG: nuclear transport factor 2 family protein [Steroidobacteraceae bacterium]